jgi:GT2 family glycosyltransferase
MVEKIVCDLVLLSWNHLEVTQPCLESLFACTRVPCRLLIVDNGSEPPVREVLRGVRPRGAIREVVLLQNERNEGFPKGMNRGIRESRAPFVCLLNNDLLFTEGWLEELIAVARSNPEVGVVNPSSSTFGDLPEGGASLEALARGLRSLRGQYTEVGMCIGFCMLITRAVLDRIGGLSEEVERIFFEDEDFCARAQQAGFRCVVAAGAYVHHAEHKTVEQLPEREALFTRNQRWCHERWGRWVRMAWPRFTPVVPGSDELRRWLERLASWAKRRTHVYVFAPTPPRTTVGDLFRSVGMIPHADVHWRAIPPRLVRWSAIGYILKRQKKRFDIIVASDDRWARTIRRLGWVHRARVVPDTDEEQLQTQWQQASRFPSSS